jgi:hypothetical protein
VSDVSTIVSCASEAKKQEMYDWQDKVLKAIKDGNNWQLTSSIYGEMQCRITLLEMRIKELERAFYRDNQRGQSQ